MRLLIICFALAIALTGCFTGVESTPKIGNTDLKRGTVAVTAEMAFLGDLALQPPARWQSGKRFFISDPKASLVFTPQSSAPLDSLSGSVISFKQFRPVRSITGEEIIEAEFATADGRSLFFRDNSRFADLADKKTLDVPFTIDLDIVEAAHRSLVGNRYYIVTPLWYTPDGSEATDGLRHVAVDITDVAPGNASYPLRVVFTAEDVPGQHSVFMTFGKQRASTRNFHTLFSFDNPKVKYPEINDDVWRLIQHSRVREGMTTLECRLALGAPQTRGQRPTTAGMVEYWQYSSGTFLLFEEGFLTRF